jgi:rhodanese-related sulfurtransferase
MQLITREELKAKMEANQDVRLVMVVGPWEYRAKHIPGSLGFPSPRYALSALRRDDAIVLYANNHHRVNTRTAYDALRANGYRNVECYLGGLADWETAGYPVEGNAVGDRGDRRWPHGHSPHGRELHGAAPHSDNGWSGSGWPRQGRMEHSETGSQDGRCRPSRCVCSAKRLAETARMEKVS